MPADAVARYGLERVFEKMFRVRIHRAVLREYSFLITPFIFEPLFFTARFVLSQLGDVLQAWGSLPRPLLLRRFEV